MNYLVDDKTGRHNDQRKVGPEVVSRITSNARTFDFYDAMYWHKCAAANATALFV